MSPRSGVDDGLEVAVGPATSDRSRRPDRRSPEESPSRDSGTGLRRWRRMVLLGFGAVVLVFGLVVADAYYQSFQIYQQLEVVRSRLASVRQQLERGVVPPTDELAEVKEDVERVSRLVQSARPTFDLVGSLPWLGRPVDGVRTATHAAREGALAADILRDTIADLLGGAAPGSAGGSAPVFHDGAVNVDLLAVVPARLEQVLHHLESADRYLRAIPSLPLMDQLEEQRASALQDSREGIELGRRALALAHLIPGFLGAEGDTRYLVALQQNATLRGTGGIVLDFAVLLARDGRLILEPSDRLDDLTITPVEAVPPLPASIRWYANRVGPDLFLGDGVNHSIDFPTVARTWVEQVRARAGVEVDGVIALDSVAVAQVLESAGSVTLPSFPEPMTADNVVTVFGTQQVLLPREERTLFAREFLTGTFARLTHPNDVLGMLEGIGSALRERHVQIWTADPPRQELIDSLGWDGGLAEPRGDFLAVAQSNLVGSNVDYYGEQAIDYTVVVGGDGSVTAICNVTIANNFPADRRPRYSENGEIAPRSNRTLVSVYSPSGTELLAPASGEAHREGATHVFTMPLEVRPSSVEEAGFSYRVPDVITEAPAESVYRLTVRAQPTLRPVRLRVTVILPPGSNPDPGLEWSVAGNTASVERMLTGDAEFVLTF